MSSGKKITFIIAVLTLLALAGGAYWYFFFHGAGTSVGQNGGTTNNGGGFIPIDRPGGTPITTGTSTTTTTATSTPEIPVTVRPPALRLLSATPIGGYGATTTASTTVVHWIDRGRGNIYEVRENLDGVTTLSNTILPKMFMSVWNFNASSFIGSIFDTSISGVSLLYAELRPRATSTAVSSTTTSGQFTPFELKGKNLPTNVLAYALSPKKDKVFLFMNENGSGVGYVSSFDGKTLTKIFTTPITQANVSWPEQNTITVTTRGSADSAGYLYFVNPTSGVMKKILGPLPGLSTVVSHDAKYVFVSISGNSGNILTSVFNVAKGTGTDAIIRTLADKCAWGNFYKNLVFCGVPSQQFSGIYPDDWYKGDIAFSDKIWQLNADTMQPHLLSSIVDQSKSSIDAFNLGLDNKDNYLFFQNKIDLSLWSLDLVDSH